MDIHYHIYYILGRYGASWPLAIPVRTQTASLSDLSPGVFAHLNPVVPNPLSLIIARRWAE